MHSKATLLAVGAFATTAFAQSASVTITASHGGAGNGLTNTTITVPLGSLYTNAALDEVSYLYLTGASDAVLDSITCTPHRYANGTGEAGRPFTSSSPSLLSTNTVKVGSLTCVASDSDDADAATGTSSSSNTAMSTSSSVAAASNSTIPSTTTSSTTSSSTEDGDATGSAAVASPMTSTFLTTISGTSSGDGQTSAQQQSTVTSVMSASGSTTVTSAVDGAGATQASETTSTSPAPASLSTDNAAPKLTFGEAVWPGLAVGALGLAMVV
ncbi:hypothetical protein KC367_g4208 [Hortaea werneckii]|uniref:Ig-like domain-containing protein n=2 Tax=Hortaea werneckii TaxID=91943 RepID=A0A3M7I1P1_HORWE|nr:hypothetical protein KC342_g13609 [Hortaea werneckii]OTA28692.1 hypothetical protein BTJ68_09541 [Hortaea werneckii EXF-2000]KAI6821262.1 hypothetical protein KC358_g9150 [Hortaea werneckii]KAI6826533.1 hypothetical protein KC350_g8503 [Hortaea werneckii]KAI6923719.1 hypothetical protein KC348_g9448 [Hortaea werneckii]